MVAVVQIHEKNGAGEAATDKTSGTIRFKNADNALANTSDPIPIPSSGTNFSFEKWLRLSVTVAPDTQIENLQAYSDGGDGLANVTVHYKTEGTYATPSKPANATGLTDFFTSNSGSPIDMDGINTGPFSGTGDIGDYLVMCWEVAAAAQQGASASETLTFSYDES